MRQAIIGLAGIATSAGATAATGDPEMINAIVQAVIAVGTLVSLFWDKFKRKKTQ